jgi:hypothetical protein
MKTKSAKLAFSVHYLYALRCKQKAKLSKELDGYWHIKVEN